jgi:DNA polymerase/3'-5' exonuclease PolX
MKIKLPLATALALAEKIKATLAPGCERIEIAGSIRRQKATVGDIEIVAIPRLCPDLAAQLSLFGEPPRMVSALDLLLEKLLEDKGNFSRDKNGEHYKNFLIEIDEDEIQIGLDLFLTTRPQWGYILALRTGPGDFNQAWVTQKIKGGLLPSQYSFSGGWLWEGDKRIPTPEEEDVWNVVGVNIPPDKRDAWRQQREFHVRGVPG